MDCVRKAVGPRAEQAVYALCVLPTARANALLEALTKVIPDPGVSSLTACWGFVAERVQGDDGGKISPSVNFKCNYRALGVS